MSKLKRSQSFIIFPWLLVAYGVTVYLSMDAYMPALPRIAHILAVTPNTAQWTATLWMLGGMSMQPIFGPASDFFGRRPVLFFGVSLFIVASLFCALATSIQWLLISRFFQGMGLPAMFIGGYAAVNEYFDTEAAIKIMAKMNAITIMAPALGPLLGSLILIHYDWHWIFIILGASASCIFVALIFNMPETHPPHKRRSAFSIKQVWQDYLDVLSNPAFILGCLIAFLPAVGLVAWLLAGPFIVIKQFHYSTYIFGLVQLCVFVSYMIATKLVSRYATLERNRHFVIAGLVVLLCGGILAELMAAMFPMHLWLTVMGIMLLMFGSGLISPIISRLALESSQVGMGVRVSVLAMIRNLIGILGALSVSLLYNGRLSSMTRVMFVFTLLTVLAFIISQRSSRYRVI